MIFLQKQRGDDYTAEPKAFKPFMNDNYAENAITILLSKSTFALSLSLYISRRSCEPEMRVEKKHDIGTKC